jgi:hypothetical protein
MGHITAKTALRTTVIITITIPRLTTLSAGINSNAEERSAAEIIQIKVLKEVLVAGMTIAMNIAYIATENASVRRGGRIPPRRAPRSVPKHQPA